MREIQASCFFYAVQGKRGGDEYDCGMCYRVKITFYNSVPGNLASSWSLSRRVGCG
jgi:hypothetical protein